MPAAPSALQARSLAFTLSAYPRPYLSLPLFCQVRTSRTFIRDCTVASPLAILLFGGSLAVAHDSSYVQVDGWLRIRCGPCMAAPAESAYCGCGFAMAPAGIQGAGGAVAPRTTPRSCRFPSCCTPAERPPRRRLSSSGCGRRWTRCWSARWVRNWHFEGWVARGSRAWMCQSVQCADNLICSLSRSSKPAQNCSL